MLAARQADHRVRAHRQALPGRPGDLHVEVDALEHPGVLDDPPQLHLAIVIPIAVLGIVLLTRSEDKAAREVA